MKHQAKETIKFIIFLLFICGVWIFGFFIGKNINKTVIIIEKTLISEEIKKCVDKNGEYAVYFNDWEGKYIEDCFYPQTKIFRHKIN
jgi:hypothetical protein